MKVPGGIFVMVLISFTISSRAEEVLKGKVTKVIDGNTFEMMAEDNESYKIVLYGVDSPELGQDYGDKAKKLLEKLLLNKNITASIQGKDRWGNRLGVAVIDNLDPRVELLSAGLAWTTERNPLQELEAIKEKAKEKGKGLWKENDPTPPWIYRRQQTMQQAKSS